MPLSLASESMVLWDVDTSSMVTYHRNYLERGEADRLLSWMLVEAHWQSESPVVYGKPRLVRRQTCSFGDAGTTYRYSGVTKTPLAWPDGLRNVRDRLIRDASGQFNFALANLYRDGKAGIGSHADNEAGIVPGSPIVGLSLGSTRDFLLERDGKRVATVGLEHGSLIVMWLHTQSHYKHSVPVRLRVTEPRVSLTFRVMDS